MWISLASKCNIFVTLGLDFNRVDRSQNGTCNAELSTIKPESSESIQSKITEPACAEFSVTQVGNFGGLSNTPKLSPMCSASVSPHGLKNDECFMCSALVSPHGLKNDECYICSALVSRHGFKNDIHFMCSALVSPHG